MRKMRTVFVLLVLVLYIQIPILCAKEKNTKHPNIIFILTDDQRWDAIGYAGNKIIHTPEMDKLANQGVYFHNAFVTTPICAASRASIFSGLHERTHRYTFQTGPIREKHMQESYPRMLQKAGYYTGFFGKFGVIYHHIDQLFDVSESYDRNNKYHDYRGYYYKTLNGDTVHLTRYTGQKALDFIEKAPSDKPFCLSLSFSAPHAHDGAPKQYFWQEPVDHLYRDVEIPKAQISEDKYFEALPEKVKEGFNRERWTWRYDTPEKYQESVKAYYRMISGVDLEIGKIRKKLKQKGLDKNTVIILMGDNGYFLGERQLAGKWLMYENCLRVPLLINDPRIKKHRDIDQMALNIDVPATILDLAGIDAPKSWQGSSLINLAQGNETASLRDTILTEHLWNFEHIPPSEGVRTSEYKYLRYINDQSIEEFYNLKSDPLEINNLADNAAYKNQLNEFREKCDQLKNKYADEILGVPTGLMVEFIREPESVKINDRLPEYNWIIPTGAGSQQSYQVLVASSKENINRNIGDIWNSGEVKNSKPQASHSGTELKANSTYFWKVRIWDSGHRLSEYSQVQKFITGDFLGNISTENKFQIEMIAPLSIKKTNTSSYFIDFGKDAFGTLVLNYQSPVSDSITIRLGEKLNDEKIDRNPGGTIRYQELKMAVSPNQSSYEVELTPNHRNTHGQAIILPDSIGVVMPFRYCELENVKTELSKKDVFQKALFHYFQNDQSSFTSSDTILNQVWELCRYSMKGTSFAGVYVDGDRERIPYEADAYINQLGHYCVDREYAMAKQTIEHFFRQPTWPTEWLLHTVMMMYQDYYYTGDTELLEKYYEPLKDKTLYELADVDGLISSFSKKVNGEYMQKLGFADSTNRLRDIVDWPPAQKDTGWKLITNEGERDGHEMLPVNTVVNCFFYENMRIMAELAEILNKRNDAKFFKEMTDKAKNSINEKLLDKEKGIYIDGIGSTHSSLHSNMLALAFDIIPEKYKKSVTDFVKSRGMACSVYGAQYLMEGLYRAGEADYALKLMTSTNDRSWWNMIRIGSTMTMEAWDMKYKPNSDWNHAWGAAPANIIPRWLWGIRPTKAGFDKVIIEPQLSNLKESSIEYPTIKGIIKASFKVNSDGSKEYKIELPVGMEGKFVNAENGKQLQIKSGQNKIEL